ncbi:G-rich sequence factor 1 isoform X3 [Astyanax mexicanus]|uniref:G-rich sequence factor 1 isoform X3 n=1 Tax=Astyanax mexicanus TaxID=7994 RepID=UPI0020CB4A63|nr:G-rich sequence factor 1 isoform X3 [Astyanax mexicanus]
MSVSGRTALVKSLLRCCGQRGSAGFRRTPRAAVCGGEGLGPVKFTVRREKHTWVIQPALNPSTTLTWTLQRRSLSSETPYKEDEYPPLPEYTPPQETDTKEVFVIRVRGLPWSCVAEDVVKFFSECQIRGSVNGIHLMHDRNGKPNGEAFIELEDEVDLHKALERHMEYLGSRYIEVYEVTNRDAEAIMKGSDMSPIKDGVVRIKGLPFNCSEEDVLEFFSGLDVAKEGVTFVLDHRGRKTGDAFVKFANQEIANQALQRDKDYIGKRYIEVFPSKNSEIHFIRRRKEASDTPLHTRRTNSVSVPIHHDNMRGLPYQTTTGDIINAPSKDEYPSSPVHTPPQETDTKEVFVIRVKGLPWSCLAEDLVKYFSECQIRGGENGIHLMYNEVGEPNGEALIELEDEEDLSKAMERHGQYIGSRYIEVYKVTNQDAEAIMKGSDMSHSEDGVVCLRGLPFNCSEEDVLEFFSGLDVVKDGVKFVLDHRGRKSGDAYVQFANQEIANQALQRDKGFIGKRCRYIEVFPSKKSDIDYSRVSKEASDTTFHTQRTNSVSVPIHHDNMRGLTNQATAGDIINAPSKEDEDPPSPVHTPPQETDTKEVFVVRVKGLPWSCLAEDLVKYFSECQIRGGVNGIHLMYNKIGKPNGEALIELEDEKDLSKAMERHGQYIGSRYIEVYKVTNQDVEAIMKGLDRSHSEDGVVCLRGLPFNCSEEDVLEFFSGLDVVKNGVTFVLDNRGRKSGNAYVQFANQETAIEALQRDKGYIGKRYIEVFLSKRSDIEYSRLTVSLSRYTMLT